MPKRCKGKTDEGKTTIFLLLGFISLIRPLVLYRHFDRSGGFNPNAAEKSPAVGEPPPASELARVHKRHFVSTRLPRRYAPRNDSGDMCVRLFYTVIPLVLRCHFDRSEGFNPNAAEKSPAVKVFRPCTTLPVPHRVTYYNVYDFTVSIFTFPQKKKPSGERRLLLFVI